MTLGTPGERPSSEDYYIPGGKLSPEDDIVPDRGPVQRLLYPGGKLGPEDDIVPDRVQRIIIFPEGSSGPEDDIVLERGPVQRIIIFPEGSSVRRTI